MPIRAYVPRQFLTEGEVHVFDRLKTILNTQGNDGLVVAKISLLQVISKCSGGNLNVRKLGKLISDNSGGLVSPDHVKGVVWSESVDLIVFPMPSVSAIPTISKSCTAIFVDRPKWEVEVLSRLMAHVGLRTFFVSSHGGGAMIGAEEAAGTVKSREAQNHWEALCSKSVRKIFDSGNDYHVFFETRLGAIIEPIESSPRDFHVGPNSMNDPDGFALRRQAKDQEEKESRALNDRAVDIAVWDKKINKIVLVVEFDGPHHFEDGQSGTDRLRDSMLSSAHIPVIRVFIQSEHISRYCDYVLERFALHLSHMTLVFSARSEREFSIRLKELNSVGATEYEVDRFMDLSVEQDCNDAMLSKSAAELELFDIENSVRALGIVASAEIEAVDNSKTSHFSFKVRYHNRGAVESSGEFYAHVQLDNVLLDREDDFLTARQRWERRVAEAKSGRKSLYYSDSIREKIISSSPPDAHEPRGHGLVPMALAIAAYEAAIFSIIA